MPGRFFLGVGSGELLNEHVVGGTWPEIPVRQERLAEAIEVIRMLLRGGERSHHGRFYTVENARIYTLPDEQIPIYVAVAGARSARLAAQLGDGIVATAPDADSVRAFEEAGGRGPRYAEMSVCFAEDEKEARRTALEIWGYSGLPSPLTVELRRPAHFEKACELVTEERIAEEIACGPDVGRCVERIEKFVAAGFDYLCLHQIGPDQEGFLRFVEQELRPRMQAREERAAARAPARTAASGGDGANDDAFARRPPADS
jgi:G6PDH family F420-dependent oxidoreductase